MGEARARRGVVLMGVCNVTPDSFSDGGRHLAPEAARARVDDLVRRGADIVDVGGESTRPGATRVPAVEQIRRIESVVRYAATKVCVSVDTTDPEVADAALTLGARVVNDVSCLADESLAEVVARHDAALVLMHARGPANARTTYGDVVADVLLDWTKARDRAVARGVDPRSMVLDPGLGFAKVAEESAALLRRLDEVVRGVDVPVLVGASRKSFLGLWTGDAPPQDRDGASIAAALVAVQNGASILRVHDVEGTRQAIDCFRALRTSKTPARREEVLRA
ncbi:MAG: dihydropteroate synthase [Polyangiaceae bacterium]